MTPQLFYGYDPAKESAPEFFPARSTRSHRRHMPGLRDLLTVRAQALNINTAGYEVMAALCAYATKDTGSGRSLAEKIITFRQGGRTDKISNNHAFRRLDDLQLVAGMSPGFLSLMKQAVPWLTIESEHFTIYCRAEAGKGRAPVRGSGGSREEKQPPPSANVVVQCLRAIMVYDLSQFPEGSPPPGCRRQSALRMNFGPVSKTNEQWYVPVTYVQRWISE
jgi:hypothetical protein